MLQINLDNVASVYSGKQGCACGCIGKHTYAKKHQAWASKNRGYAVSDDEVSDNAVKRMVNKLIKLEATGTLKEIIVDDQDVLAFDTETRSYTIYFKTEK